MQSQSSSALSVIMEKKSSKLSGNAVTSHCVFKQHATMETVFLRFKSYTGHLKHFCINRQNIVFKKFVNLLNPNKANNEPKVYDCK